MVDRVLLGRAGEELAAHWLESLGYDVLEQNLYTRWGEVDLLCSQGRYLVFVEVRFRRTETYGTPGESVTRSKRRHLLIAASFFVSHNPLGRGWAGDYRFDLVEICLTRSPSKICLSLLPNFIEGGGWL